MIGTAIDSAKAVAKLAQEYGKIDLYQQAVELMAKVTEQQQQIMELSQEVFDLKKQLSAANNAEAVSQQLSMEQNAYFRTLEGGKRDGPFCCRCFDVDRMLVRARITISGPFCEQCYILRQGGGQRK